MFCPNAQAQTVTDPKRHESKHGIPNFVCVIRIRMQHESSVAAARREALGGSAMASIFGSTGRVKTAAERSVSIQSLLLSMSLFIILLFNLTRIEYTISARVQRCPIC